MSCAVRSSPKWSHVCFLRRQPGVLRVGSEDVITPWESNNTYFAIVEKGTHTSPWIGGGLQGHQLVGELGQSQFCPAGKHVGACQDLRCRRV